MAKLEWCKNQKNGIKSTEPNNNLAYEYIKNAEESLEVFDKIRETRSNMWLATTKYYIKYFAFYAFLMKIGIKSEIHDCTIEIAKLLEQNKILQGNVSSTLEKDKELRIDNQYYLKNKPVAFDIEKLRKFVMDMKVLVDSLDEKKVERIRNLILNS